MPHVNGQSRALLAGLVLGGLVLVGLSVKTRQLEGRVNALRLACVEDVKTSWFGQQGVDAETFCDPLQLAGANHDAPGIQGELAGAQRAAIQWSGPRAAWMGVAILIIIGSALPWLWHFFLRRIREVSAAVRGT